MNTIEHKFSGGRHCKGEVLEVVDDAVVDGEVACGAEEAVGVVAVGDGGFDGDEVVGGEDLAAVEPGVFLGGVGVEEGGGVGVLRWEGGCWIEGIWCRRARAFPGGATEGGGTGG